MNRSEFRANILADYGANTAQIEELLAYNCNIYDHSSFTFPCQFPLVSEPYIATWQEYAERAKSLGVFETLKQVLVQFQFPIQEGIGQTEAYRAATRKGIAVDNLSEATGLVLNQPQSLELIVHQSLAGAIPVLIAGEREDFISLVRALTMSNEPKAIPASMGACIVSGYNNWDRIRRYRKQWSVQHLEHRYRNPKNPVSSSLLNEKSFFSTTETGFFSPTSEYCTGALGYDLEADWVREFRQLIVQKHLYQDKFIILSRGSYSNVSAEDLGLEESEWLHISLKIRLEHECTHYFTRRLFSSMRNHLHDELIADYRGIVAATGYYRADWFLRFLGLESFPDYREGGRLENYRGQPPLSDGSFKILQALVKDAAKNLERFDTEYPSKLRTTEDETLALIALTYLTLEELASKQANSYIQNIINQLQTICCA
jgi:hypothetical protein